MITTILDTARAAAAAALVVIETIEANLAADRKERGL